MKTTARWLKQEFERALELNPSKTESATVALLV